VRGERAERPGLHGRLSPLLDNANTPADTKGGLERYFHVLHNSFSLKPMKNEEGQATALDRNPRTTIWRWRGTRSTGRRALLLTYSA